MKTDGLTYQFFIAHGHIITVRIGYKNTGKCVDITEHDIKPDHQLWDIYNSIKTYIHTAKQKGSLQTHFIVSEQNFKSLGVKL
jgi:hypothetical protein